jgi:dienelactone hydrolase
MAEISAFLETQEQIKDNYEILTVSEPTIEREYGVISIVKIKGGNPEYKPLVVIPGYSNDSFESGFNILMQELDHIKKNYSEIYAFCWGSTVKKLTQNYSEHEKDEEKAFALNEKLRIILAHLLDKIIRSPDMKLTNISVLAKSAGAGVAIHMAAINPEIKFLYIACPGTNGGGKTLKYRKDLPIKLMWNKDDNKIPFETSEKFIDDFKKQGNNYTFYEYEKGGHEFNVEFIKEL